MNGIFISYRRDDAAGYAGRLYDRLAAHFGTDRVFMDVQGIEPGVDFVEAIERALRSCEILIVLIGKDWLAADTGGRRRLDDPTDFVRLETVTALNRGIRVVPVLVEGVPMPRADQLPSDLLPLVRRQAVELSHKQWDATSAELIRTLEKILDRDKAKAAAGQAARPSAEVRSPESAPAAAQTAAAVGTRRTWLYWGLGALVVLIAAGMLYMAHPWRRDGKAPPSPAVFSVTPDRVDFAEQKVLVAGSAAAITITNRGEVALRVGSVKLEGPAAADFVLSENQCSRGELAPGSSCALKVIFTPQSAGSRAATLVIGAANATANVAMQGRGAEPVVAEVTPRVDKATSPSAIQPPSGEGKSEVATVQPKLPSEGKPEVAAVQPKILRFDSRVVGDKVQLCYGVENAASATIAPEPGSVRPLGKECLFVPAATTRTTYTLNARNAEGAVVSRAIVVEPIAKQQPELLVAVPNEVGKTRRDATAELEKAGFEAHVVERPDSKAAVAVDSVLAQTPKGGAQVKVGERVTLEIATAPSTVPAAPPAAALPAGFPHVGDRWEYNFRSMWKTIEARTFVHQVTAVSDHEVRETMSFVDKGARTSDSKAFAAESRFVEWRGQGYYFVEFNPFIQAFGELQPGTTWKALVTPIEDPFFSNWYSQGRVVRWESVSVPAGNFKALRVELDSTRPSSANSAAQAAPAHIRYVIWYSPDAKRTVKHVRTAFRTDGTQVAEDTYELVKYAVQ
ncbi:MAG TPA: choice-of-anchor D domain-containing protein [Casimicrobiaceae bacterium]|nr:choice-of-anchor D domain-containing protein [Casimicrobiaceae bacterium]